MQICVHFVQSNKNGKNRELCGRGGEGSCEKGVASWLEGKKGVGCCCIESFQNINHTLFRQISFDEK